MVSQPELLIVDDGAVRFDLNRHQHGALRPQITSTRENCLGTECGHYNECFVMNARKQALAADVVVINHHLFFADVMLKDEGIAELLPASNTVILDEAHQLPETATRTTLETFSRNATAITSRSS